MAPEVLNKDEGAIRYGVKADLWATGVVIHEMLSMWTPFRFVPEVSRMYDSTVEYELYREQSDACKLVLILTGAYGKR